MSVRLVFAAVCLSLGTIRLSAAEPKFNPLILPDSVRFVSVLTPDQKVGSMLFDNLVLDTRTGKATLPSVETKRFVHVLSVESAEASEVTYDIRGFVANYGGGSASLLFHAGGESTLIDLDAAIKEANKCVIYRETYEPAKKQAEKEGFCRKPPERADNFYVRLKRSVPANGKLQTTLLLLVDRLDTDEDSGAMLAIDSFDFGVTAAPTKAAKK